MTEYMQNLAEEQQAAADLMLAPMIPAGSKVDKAATAATLEDWRLPCHSLILSTHSKAFAASQRHASSTKAEKTADGKRIVRLPICKTVALDLLRYSYGSVIDWADMHITGLCGLAFISNMQGVEGDFLLFWAVNVSV